jgi:hypothetical protein
MASKFLTALTLCSLIIVNLSCTRRHSEWQGTIEKENGVIIVRNPKEPLYGPEVFDLELELTIGEAEGPKEYMFTDIRYVAVDDDENIYVADVREAHIKIFDKNGDYISTVGRKGQGPGDIQFPRNVCITNQKQIMVPDSGNLWISFFSKEGKYIRNIRTTPRRLLEAKVDTEGNIIGLEVIQEEENQRHELNKFDSDLNFLFSIDFSPIQDINNVNPFIPPLSWDIDENDRIICGWGKTYEIKIFDVAGDLTHKIVKDYDPIEIAETELERLKDIPPGIVLSVPKYHAAFWRLFADDEGRIYVMTWERQVEAGYVVYHDVFSPDGKYLAKIPLQLRTLAIKNSRVYTVETDEYGFYVVRRYKATWRIEE